MKITWFINLNRSTDINPSNLFMSNEIVNYSDKILITSSDNFFIINKKSGSIEKKFSFSSLIKPIINENYVF